jgi:hypothetical protein
VSVSIKRIEGVESVNISLNRGLAEIRLHPRNTVRVEQILRAVTNNGFTPKEARISAVGTVLSREDKLRFQASGSNQNFDLLMQNAAKDLNDAVRKEIGRTAVVEGIIPISKDRIPQAIVVSAIRQVDAGAVQ